MTRPLTLCVALVAGLHGMVGSGAEDAPPQPNVLLIVSEDNGPELGCYGDPYVRTPNLDALAAEGVRFDRAFVTYSVCSPSRASIFTGLYPHQNGQIGLATHKFAMYREWPNTASLLKQRGYRTGIIGKIHVNPESAFPCDFRAFPGSNFNDRPVARFAEEAGRFIDAGDEPFFLMVNYPDAHFPLIHQQHGQPPQPLTGNDVKTLPWVGVDTPRLRKYTADYYNCLMRLDAGVGMLLEKLDASGKADDTLVIYLGDHGAQFSRGKTSVYEAGLRIPLIVRFPGRTRRGLVRDELVSTVDLLPTILDAVGAGASANLPGRSLLPLCCGENKPWREYVVGVTTGAAPVLYFPQTSIRDQRYKLIVSPLRGRPNVCADHYRNQRLSFFVAGVTPEELEGAPEHVQRAFARYLNPPPVELYDLQTDPFEWHNLADDPAHDAVQRRLFDALRSWQQQTRDPLADATMLRRFTAEHDRAPERNYRRDRSFRWDYLDYFREYMH